jgi:uncharacterized cupredoxin-like copper-binding protein
MPAHILKMDGGGHTGHQVGRAGFGMLGDPSQVTRTLRLSVGDEPRFDLSAASVHAGETVEVVVHNQGRGQHEVVLGDSAHQAEYERILAAMPNARHQHDNVLSVGPGETRSMVWRFGNAPLVELACHMQGHYAAGMKVQVRVSP